MKVKFTLCLNAFVSIFFTALISVPLQVSAQQDSSVYGKGLTRNAIESGMYSGFLFTDVKGIRLQFNGFVQADFIHDFMEIGNAYAMQPSSITTPTVHDGNTAFSIRQTRFSFTAYGAPDYKGRKLKAVLELDLWGSTSGNPRLRHAYIQHGKWLFGQTWSNFMDGDNWPNVVDYWGPNSYIFTRLVQLRFTQSLSKHATLSFSAEQPGGDIMIPVNWVSRTVYPDITGALQFDFGKSNESHVRISGLLHPIDYKNGKGDKKTNIGGAGNISGNIYLSKDNDVKFQFAYGSGYAKYSEDLSGLGYDAFAHAFDKRLYNIQMLAPWLYFDHFWTKSLGSTIGYGYLHLNTKDLNMPGETIKDTHYASFNTTYYYTSFFKIAGEVMYGRRVNVNGDDGNDIRAQFTAFFKF
ncbi:hypothetical protein DVR12_13370 [Chitinophaga silvatica]|uniref:Porin n=1 Tax=Chitinophaga silvatica TaxID=2282649 RepID=A0A3E1YAW1_9BACT|nr:DcaP family trimeric outer membrane transporter [Chitinophaga silvatica]RFS22776.1 hypothetical protein DVR12_13370 [Chitinophaga silvatica]